MRHDTIHNDTRMRSRLLQAQHQRHCLTFSFFLLLLCLPLRFLLPSYAKVYLRCKNALGISAISPKPYADRFIRFMNDITRGEDLDDELGPASPIMPASPVHAPSASASASFGFASSPASPSAAATAGSAQHRFHAPIDEALPPSTNAFHERSEEKRAFAQQAPAPASPVRTNEVRLDVNSGNQNNQQQQRLFSGMDSASSNAGLSAQPSFLAPSSPFAAASAAAASDAASGGSEGTNAGEEAHPLSAAEEQFGRSGSGSTVRPMNIMDSEAATTGNKAEQGEDNI